MRFGKHKQPIKCVFVGNTYGTKAPKGCIVWSNGGGIPKLNRATSSSMLPKVEGITAKLVLIVDIILLVTDPED